MWKQIPWVEQSICFTDCAVCCGNDRLDTTDPWYSPTGFCVSRLFPLYVSNRLRDAYLVLPSFPFAVCPERSDIALSAHWVWWALRLWESRGGNREREREREKEKKERNLTPGMHSIPYSMRECNERTLFILHKCSSLPLKKPQILFLHEANSCLRHVLIWYGCAVSLFGLYYA